MPLFALTPDPATLGASDWLGSVHRGRCYVAATTERRARVHAANAFVARAVRTPGGLLLASPWTCRRLVAAERVIGPGSGAPTGGAPLSDAAMPEGTVVVPADPGDPRGAYRLWDPEPTAA
jgi:hypothetical protein